MTFDELLKSKRYNRSTMAKELKLSSGAVFYWATKRSSPSPEQIKRMSELLECTTDEVINSLLSEE